MRRRVLGDRYVLEKRIGEGGMGIVYRALDQVTDQVVAVKIIREHIACESRAVMRFLREAKAARRLSHPNIVRMLDDGTDIEHYIVMEYVEGVTIREWVRTYGRAHVSIVAMLGEVLAALHHAHSRGIIHRDIKPENILVTEDRRIKLMDFGLARSMNGSSGETITQTGAIVGTVAYMSPEQAAGKRGDERSDLYSLGIVAYELLTGKRPFTGDSPMAILVKQIQDEPMPPSRHNPGLPSQLEYVILRLLAKRPDERYASAATCWEDLRRCLEKPARGYRPSPSLGTARATPLQPMAGSVVPPTVADIPRAVDRDRAGERVASPASRQFAFESAVDPVPARPEPPPHPATRRPIRYPVERKAIVREKAPTPEAPRVEVAILHTRVQCLQEVLDELTALEAAEVVGQYERAVEALAAQRQGRVLCRSGPTQVLVFDGSVMANPAEAALQALSHLKQEVTKLRKRLQAVHPEGLDLFLSAGVYTAMLGVPGDGSLDDSIGEELLNGARRLHDYSASERKYCMLCDLSHQRVSDRVTSNLFCSTYIAGRKNRVQVFEVLETAG